MFLFITFILIEVVVLSVAVFVSVNKYAQPTMLHVTDTILSNDSLLLNLLSTGVLTIVLIIAVPVLMGLGRLVVDKTFDLVSFLEQTKPFQALSVAYQVLGLALTLALLRMLYIMSLSAIVVYNNMDLDWLVLLNNITMLEYNWEWDTPNWGNTELFNVLDTNNVASSFIATGVLCDNSNTTDKFIPWHHTTSLQNGINGLNRMYDSLPDNSSLKLFLTENCSFLLKELKGYTDLPTSLVELNNLKISPNTVKLGPTMSNSYSGNLKSVAGVYLFFEPDTNTISQCGSSINIHSRLVNHYTLTKDHQKDFYQHAFKKAGGLNAYWWNPIWTTDNWEKQYVLSHKDVPQEHVLILRSFLQQYIRSVEQSISTYCNPTFWKGTDINTWHTNWQPGDTLAKSNEGFTTNWLTRDEEIFSQSSMKQAAEALGLSLRSVERAANCTPPYWVDSPNYGEVSISMPNKAMKGPFSATYDKEYNTLVNVSSLLPNKYYLYSPDMEKMDVGPFNTITEVNKAVGVNDDRQNLRWVNKMHLIKGSFYAAGVYLVCNRVSRMTPVTITVDNECHEFDSMSQASVFLYGSKRGMDKIIKRYVLVDKPYVYKGKTYLIEYVNLADHLRYKDKYGL